MKDVINIQKKLSISVEEAMEKLKSLPNRPSEMAYFDYLARNLTDKEFIEEIKKEGKKIIGTFCVFVPEEFIYAAGAIPLRLCAGIFDTVAPVEEFLPRDACPVIKSSLGLIHLKLLPQYEFLDLVVIPTTCDWKMKYGEIINSYFPVWVLNLPHQKEIPSAKRFWKDELKTFISKLQSITGKRINRRSLRDSIRLLNRAQAVFRKLYKLRQRKRIPIWGSDAMLVMSVYFFSDINKWIDGMERLVSEIEKRDISVCPDNSPRIMLCGSPIIWPNWKLPFIIESSGGVIVADEFCSSSRIIYDTVQIDEYTERDLFNAVCERYLLPCTCPCFTPNEDRKRRILQMVDDFSVEGVVYHVYKGCFIYDMELYGIEKALKEKGIPVIRIETDYSPEDIEQIRTRIEAFLEMLIARRP